MTPEQDIDTQEEHPLAGLKVVVTVLDVGSVLIGVSRGAVDPHMENFAISSNADLNSILAVVPEVLERARERWASQPRFTNYQPPAAAPAPRTRQQVTRSRQGANQPDEEVQRPRMFD
jgi:hypothetical protein